MEHEPDVSDFIQTDLDEMVSGTQCPEVVRVVAAVELRVLREDPVVTCFQLAQPSLPFAPECRAMRPDRPRRHVRPPVRHGRSRSLCGCPSGSGVVAAFRLVGPPSCRNQYRRQPPQE